MTKRNTFWRLAVLMLFFGLAAAGFAYWYGFLRQEKPVSKMKSDFVLTADSLFSLFSSDEKSATEKFGGKIVELEARLISLSREENGNITITLVDPVMGVTCTIDSPDVASQEAEIARLTEGMPVKIKGRCDGMLTDVKVSRCILVK